MKNKVICIYTYVGVILMVQDVIPTDREVPPVFLHGDMVRQRKRLYCVIERNQS